MKGLALNQDNNLELTDRLEEPEPNPGEVKVKMLAGGVCGSDLHSIGSGVRRPSYPWAIGHEGGGVIVDVAPDVTDLAVGDLVVVEPNYVCLQCYWCRRGETKMCEHRTVVGAHVQGLFREFITASTEFTWKLPPGTPKSVMADLEPKVVADGAVDRYLPTHARNVLVIGAGSQGLLVCLRLAAAGITPAVLDPKPDNLHQAIEIGARDANQDPDERFDLVFETSGAPAGFDTALARAEKLANVCLIGQTARPVQLPLRPMVQRELTIQGHLIYNHPRDFRTTITEYLQDPHAPIGLREPVTPKQGLQDILEAHQLPGKIFIDLEDWD
jgi:alcohol dehydrogenase/L-iditol 2-dehydrogenase